MPRLALRRETRTLTGFLVIAVLSLVMTVLWVSRANAGPVEPASAVLTVPPTTTEAPTSTTTTVPPPPPTTTTTTAPPPPPPPPPPPTTTAPPALPAYGQATAYGCEAALAYLHAYADPKYQLECPGYSDGHQAVTCISEAPCAPGQWMIGITVPCAAAYMNEAHNSWVLDHEETGATIPDGSSAIDPYGYCH